MRRRWPTPANRRARAIACANTTWLLPTESSRDTALTRVRNGWLDGYEAAMRDARKMKR